MKGRAMSDNILWFIILMIMVILALALYYGAALRIIMSG